MKRTAFLSITIVISLITHNLLCILPAPRVPTGPRVNIIIHSSNIEETRGVLEDLLNQTHDNWHAQIVLPSHAPIQENYRIITELNVQDKITISHKGTFELPEDTLYLCHVKTDDLLDEGYVKWVVEERPKLQAPKPHFNSLVSILHIIKILCS